MMGSKSRVGAAVRSLAGCLLLSAAGCGTTNLLDGREVSSLEPEAGSSSLAGRGPVAGEGGTKAPIAGRTGPVPVAGSGGPIAAIGGASPLPVAGVGSTRPLDRDRDGFDVTLDCDDLRPDVFPGAPDGCCDGVDSDCNGSDDPIAVACLCAVTNDLDGDGYPNDVMGPKWDCDDNDAHTYPFAPEICGDNRDNNCNGLADWQEKECAAPPTLDRDGDGYASLIDCNDFDPKVNQGVPDFCGDGIDNDCDGKIDQGCMMPIDFDHDGYAQGLDCNDWDNRTYPGSSDETCCDSVDSDCDGQDDPRGVKCNCFDADGDGFVVGPISSSQADCNDQDASINPGSPEICSDGIDNDCDRRTDGDDSDCRVTLPI